MSTARQRIRLPAEVFRQFSLEPASIEPLTGGLINWSFGATRTDGTRCVLQRVSSIFPEAINDDIDAITQHLLAKGLVTPLLLRTVDGRNRVVSDGKVWRLLTRIEGVCHDAIPDDATAREAGRLLGRFHAALADFRAPIASQRLGVHDTQRHLEHLRQTLTLEFQHRAHAAVSELAAQIFHLARIARPPPGLPDRMVHGDPKISNVLFADDRAVCLIDLDTVARMPVALELGDALRSWCNLSAEDAPESEFSLSRFNAAIEGYAEGSAGLLTPAEWSAIPAATLTIAVELAARFGADALHESYFAWDDSRYDSASDHNQARTAAQIALATSIEQALPEMQKTVAEA
ncbi:MAG: phosphotransferase, partial [Gammaproteobacteria bacterium]|nr:phosphotransferase [Gammaproteobacteria bacterium]